MKKLIVILAAIAIMAAMVIPGLAAGSAPKAYETAAEGELLYTVDFRADNGVINFDVLAGSKAAELFDYIPSADGTALTIKGKAGKTGTAGCLWGGAIETLTTGKDIVYTMTYQVSSHGDQGKNNSIGVGGYFSTSDGATMLNFYSNYNTQDENGSTTMRRGVLQAGSEKINSAEYTMFSDLSKNINIDQDGFVTCMVIFDGKNAAISAYILAEGATDLSSPDSWLHVATQLMIPTSGTMGFGLYSYYAKNVNATIKNVNYYKGTLADVSSDNGEATEPTEPATEATEPTAEPTEAPTTKPTTKPTQPQPTETQPAEQQNQDGGDNSVVWIVIAAVVVVAGAVVAFVLLKKKQ